MAISSIMVNYLETMLHYRKQDMASIKEVLKNVKVL